MAIYRHDDSNNKFLTKEFKDLDGAKDFLSKSNRYDAYFKNTCIDIVEINDLVYAVGKVYLEHHLNDKDNETKGSYNGTFSGTIEVGASENYEKKKGDDFELEEPTVPMYEWLDIDTLNSNLDLHQSNFYNACFSNEDGLLIADDTIGDLKNKKLLNEYVLEYFFELNRIGALKFSYYERKDSSKEIYEIETKKDKNKKKYVAFTNVKEISKTYYGIFADTYCNKEQYKTKVSSYYNIFNNPITGSKLIKLILALLNANIYSELKYDFGYRNTCDCILYWETKLQYNISYEQSIGMNEFNVSAVPKYISESNSGCAYISLNGEGGGGYIYREDVAKGASAVIANFPETTSKNLH